MQIGVKVDEAIMEELLNSEGVRENVAQMQPQVLAFFRQMLVRDGIYQRFVLERQHEQLEKAWNGSGKGRKRH